MDLSNAIKTLARKKNVKFGDIAKALEITPQRFSGKLKSENQQYLRVEDIDQIAEILGYELCIELKNDAKNVQLNCKTINEDLNNLDKNGMILDEFTSKLGLTRQAWHKKITSGKPTYKDLQNVASVLGYMLNLSFVDKVTMEVIPLYTNQQEMVDFFNSGIYMDTILGYLNVVLNELSIDTSDKENILHHMKQKLENFPCTLAIKMYQINRHNN